METELLAFSAAATVRDVIRDLRANQQRYAAIGVQYLYVVDQSRHLLGVAPRQAVPASIHGNRPSTP